MMSGAECSTPVRQPSSLMIYFVFSACLLFIALNAWLCDDAFITLRVADNFSHGYGLRWNIDERVQVFTHPLWLALISVLYSLTNDYHISLIGLSVLLSAVTLILICCCIARDFQTRFFALCSLSLSMAFVDYSTSGLENPLTHLLLCGFLWLYFQDEPGARSLRRLAFVTALLLCTRMDLGLLCLPALVVAAARVRATQAVLNLLLGAIPFLAWELFALFYYGSFFPNTAFAKLGSGAPLHYFITRGAFYLLDSILRDPITLIVIVSAIVFAFRDASWRYRALGAGLALYVLYIICVGGDFMSGRFLSAPFVFGVCLLSFRRDWWAGFEKHIAAVMIIAALTRALSAGTFTTGYDLFSVPQSMLVVDERLFFNSNPVVLIDKSAVVAQTGVGMLGFLAGPEARIIDPFALTDPLLSRLPAIAGVPFRIGHVRREIPAGYEESMRSGTNVIQDQDLRRFYDVVRTLTRDPIWDTNRLRTIFKYQRGKFDHYTN